MKKLKNLLGLNTIILLALVAMSSGAYVYARGFCESGYESIACDEYESGCMAGGSECGWNVTCVPQFSGCFSYYTPVSYCDNYDNGAYCFCN